MSGSNVRTPNDGIDPTHCSASVLSLAARGESDEQRLRRRARERLEQTIAMEPEEVVVACMVQGELQVAYCVERGPYGTDDETRLRVASLIEGARLRAWDGVNEGGTDDGA